MKVTTIGFDLQRMYSRSTGLMSVATLCSASSYDAIKWQPFSPTCQRV